MIERNGEGNPVIFLVMIFAIASVIFAYFLYIAPLESGQIQIKSKATGSGSFSGAHFNLNIIGVVNGKTADTNTGNGIFVPLTGSCQIDLTDGSFAVSDNNCTDGKSQFQLPNPALNNNGITTYSVWVRALRKPSGQQGTITCTTDPTDGSVYCSVYSMVQVINKGKSNLTDVTKQLLNVYTDINADGNLESIPLFDESLKNYYWQYDNNGQKIVQFRFYEIPFNVN